MEVLNISLDDNEVDTSHDELDEDPDFRDVLLSLSSPTPSQSSRYINREVISSAGQFSKLFQDWERPQLQEGTLFYSSSSLEAQPDPFRFLFLDSVSSVSRLKHGSIKLDRQMKNAPLHTVIRLFGVARVPEYSASEDLFDDKKHYSDKGTFSVCCNVHGFLPYFYALPTIEYGVGSTGFIRIKRELEDKLNEDVAKAVLDDLTLVEVHNFLNGGEVVPDVVRIEGMRFEDVENSIFLFPSSYGKSKEWAVLKIYVALPMFIPTVARLLGKTILEGCEFEMFENTLTNNIRFLADQNIPGCTWVELKGGKYFRRSDASGGLERESHCQIELDVHFNDILKTTETEQHKGIPPLRVLSFDLESRVIPNEQSQIIQIGAVISTYRTTGDTIIGKAAFVLGPCDALSDAKVVQFYDKDNPTNNTEANLMESEALLLASFRDFMIQMDPDIITGYNIKNFDLPYLHERAEKYVYQFEEVKRFPFLGRLKQIKTSVRPILNENKKLYKFDKQLVNIQGRIIMDMYPLYIRHDTCRGKSSLKLKDVSQRHLPAGEKKDDVKYTEINALQDGNPTSRKRLAKYCVQDSYLPVKLMMVHLPDRKSAQINFLEYYFELSQLSGTIMRYLVNKSKDYNKYFKQVRVQKNNGRVKYYPDSPTKKPPPDLENGTPSKDQPTTAEKEPRTNKRKGYSSRMLFTDGD